jgi:hypothetical protein
VGGTGRDHDTDTVWIQSTRGPDNDPVCQLTWGPLQWYAPVDAVRDTALDLITCAAYADMMLLLITEVRLPPQVVSRFASHLVSQGRDKRYFGAKTTITLIPAGGHDDHGRREAVVLLQRGSKKAFISPATARQMALDWLAAAEATESDQKVSEALAAANVDPDRQDMLFAYLRQLRDSGGPDIENLLKEE